MKEKIENQLGQLSVEFAGMRVRIEGNTDIIGSAAMNRDLSYKRARSVGDYLVKTYNFDPNRFIIVAMARISRSQTIIRKKEGLLTAGQNFNC